MEDVTHCKTMPLAAGKNDIFYDDFEEMLRTFYSQTKLRAQCLQDISVLYNHLGVMSRLLGGPLTRPTCDLTEL